MKNKGQTTVETAFMIIVLFLLVFGITEFGRAMYIKNCLNNAARAAVRAAVVNSPLNDQNYSAGSFTTRDTYDDTTPPATKTRSIIQQKIFDSLFYMNKADVSATVTSTNSPAVAGDTVTVQLTLNGFASFVPRLITIGNTLVGTASMRYE